MILWLDLETTGLDPKNDQILEVAAILTSMDLVVMGRFSCVIGRTFEELQDMDKWCTEQHLKSGLVRDCVVGQMDGSAVTIEHAEEELLALVKMSLDKPFLAGNSIHFDRSFIKEHMPELDKKLHYRMLDLTSFKIMAKMGNWEIPKGDEMHRAIGDIEESLAQCRQFVKRLRQQ